MAFFQKLQVQETHQVKTEQDSHDEHLREMSFDPDI